MNSRQPSCSTYIMQCDKQPQSIFKWFSYNLFFRNLKEALIHVHKLHDKNRNWSNEKIEAIPLKIPQWRAGFNLVDAKLYRYCVVIYLSYHLPLIFEWYSKNFFRNFMGTAIVTSRLIELNEVQSVCFCCVLHQKLFSSTPRNKQQSIYLM